MCLCEMSVSGYVLCVCVMCVCVVMCAWVQFEVCVDVLPCVCMCGVSVCMYVMCACVCVVHTCLMNT